MYIKSSLSALAVALAGILAGTSPCSAVPITYIEVVDASGFFGGTQSFNGFDGTSFTNAGVFLTMQSDTANIQNASNINTPSYFINDGTITVTVRGVGSGTLSEAVIADTVDGGLCAFQGNGSDILDTNDASCATYKLDTSFGPINNNGLTGGIQVTSNGVLRLTSLSRNPVFLATTSGYSQDDPIRTLSNLTCI